MYETFRECKLTNLIKENQKKLTKVLKKRFDFEVEAQLEKVESYVVNTVQSENPTEMDVDEKDEDIFLTQEELKTLKEGNMPLEAILKNRQFRAGQRIVVFGLESSRGKFINGKVGRLRNFKHDKKRWVVQFEHNSECILLKQENLKPIAEMSTFTSPSEKESHRDGSELYDGFEKLSIQDQRQEILRELHRKKKDVIMDSKRKKKRMKAGLLSFTDEDEQNFTLKHSKKKVEFRAMEVSI